ncbi:MAG: DUF2283 domain-containing protein [Nitrospirota bacterium]
MKEVHIIPLAERKLARRGIPREWVVETIRTPDQVVEGYGGRVVAQRRYRVRAEDMLLRGHWVPDGCSHAVLEGERAMRIEYDSVHDLLNIEFLKDAEIVDSLELDGIVVDYAKDKRIVAIKVLDASKRTTRDPLDLIDLAIIRATPSRPDVVRETQPKYRKKKKRAP